jgi:hypothetical protein
VRRAVEELSALSAAEQELLGQLCKRLGRPSAEPARLMASRTH